jgi:plasmid stabilization system protein ParE
MNSARSTAYRVEISTAAAHDFDYIYEEIGASTSPAAADWYSSLEELILRLARLPERGAPLPENRALRQLLHGNKPHSYRIIYDVVRSRKLVRILHIRHGARKALPPE